MVTLVVTTGFGSMDLYSQQLSEKLDLPKVYTDIYQHIRNRSNISWFSREAARAILADWNFIKMLHKLSGVVHLPNQHMGRYGKFLKTPYIITVHDLIRYFDLKGYGTYIHRPNSRDRFYLTRDYRGVTKATRIIAVSQATKRDLMYYLRIPEERIRVVYEGIDHTVFRPSPRSKNFGYPYILFVGSEQPRKNLPTLIKAFAKLKERKQFTDLKLVKVGWAGGKETNFREETMKVIKSSDLDGQVIFTEFVSREDLRARYCDAECFVLPSLYEGFGFPPLEAMACGCPVITSDSSSLPEVVDGAAIKVSPGDVEGLAEALQKVLTDQQLVRSLVERGIAQAAKFSWEETAEKTLEVYKEVEKELL